MREQGKVLLYLLYWDAAHRIKDIHTDVGGDAASVTDVGYVRDVVIIGETEVR